MEEEVEEWMEVEWVEEVPTLGRLGTSTLLVYSVRYFLGEGGLVGEWKRKWKNKCKYKRNRRRKWKKERRRQRLKRTRAYLNRLARASMGWPVESSLHCTKHFLQVQVQVRVQVWVQVQVLVQVQVRMQVQVQVQVSPTSQESTCFRPPSVPPQTKILKQKTLS